MYDVVIVGGGVAGISCGVTLASATNKFEWAKDKKYLILDDGCSDLEKASLFNVPGFEYGISGKKAMVQMREHLSHFESIEQQNGKVVSISGKKDDFTIKTTTQEYKAKRVVLATGMHSFDIEGISVDVQPHDKVLKPNKIKLSHNDNRVMDGLYVAGLLSGVKTMYLIAAGDGTKVACDIFEEWTGKMAVSHDSIKDALLA